MTPHRPIELSQASYDLATAWDRRDQYLEADDKVGVEAMDGAIEILQERYNTLYREWQILGGTSDIESIAFPFADYDHADWLDYQSTRESDRPV